MIEERIGYPDKADIERILIVVDTLMSDTPADIERIPHLRCARVDLFLKEWQKFRSHGGGVLAVNLLIECPLFTTPESHPCVPVRVYFGTNDSHKGFKLQMLIHLNTDPHQISIEDLI